MPPVPMLLLKREAVGKKESNMIMPMHIIDYIYQVGEMHGRSNGQKGTGSTVLVLIWYFDILIPLLSLIGRHLSYVWFVAVVITGIVFPFVFCRMRYTERRRQMLDGRYAKMKHTGRKMLLIITACIGVFVLWFLYCLGK